MQSNNVVIDGINNLADSISHKHTHVAEGSTKQNIKCLVATDYFLIF